MPTPGRDTHATRRTDDGHDGGRGARRVLILAAAVAAATLVLAACSSPTEEDTLSATQGLPDTTQALEAHTWVLDRSASTPAIDGTATVTLAFDAGGASGQAPCNTYRGPFTADGDDIDIGPLATTQIGCDDATAAAEHAYLSALEAVDQVDVTDPTEVVLTGDGITLAYDRIDLDAAIVGRWDVTSLNTGDALTSPVAGTAPTLTFEDDGTLAVDAGCNPLSTTWSLDGAALSLGPMRSGMKACDQPAGVMEQEQALSTAVTSARRVAVTDHLTLLDNEGRIMVTASRPAP
jgi:heat shock protein HslJ